VEDSSNAAVYNKNHPFIVNSIEREKLSSDGSSKVVNHVAISLAGGGEDIHYDVGDALEVWSLNVPQQVAGILNAGGFSGREIVTQKSGSATLRVLLSTQLDIMTVNAKGLQTWGIIEAPDDFQDTTYLMS